jgi:thiol-disulfide isomerase/thioredoxin
MAKNEKTKLIKTLKQWNPEIAVVTFVGILVILGTNVFLGSALNDMKSAVLSAQNSPSASPSTYNTNSSASACVFTCQVNPKLLIPLDALSGATACATAGKVNVLAFHSPTCPYCEAQLPALTQLKQKYGSQLNITYVCTEIHAQDPELCQNNTGGKFLPYAQSQALVTQYKSAVSGTPTLVFNCEYARVGSYSMQDAAKEQADLDKVISTLLGS